MYIRAAVMAIMRATMQKISHAGTVIVLEGKFVIYLPRLFVRLVISAVLRSRQLIVNYGSLTDDYCLYTNHYTSWGINANLPNKTG